MNPISLTYPEAIRQAAIPVVPNFRPGLEYGDRNRVFQGIPGIETASGGRLWATWYSGGQGESPLNYIMLSTSDDRGEHWSEPLLVLDPPGSVRAADPNIWLDPSGKLWLFWMQTHTLHDGRWGVWAMTTEHPDDERPDWSPPRRLTDGIMLNKPTVCKNGEWLFPISLLPAKFLENEKKMLPPFLRNNLSTLISPEEKQRIDEKAGAWILSSIDGGKTFSQRGRVIVPEEMANHNEHMIVERKDRTLQMWIRTKYGIGLSTSTDQGKNWSPAVPSGIPHTVSRFFVRRLRSGRLLLVKNGPMHEVDASGNREIFDRSRLTAFLSEDDGRSWPRGLLLEERGCTYPDGTQTGDGTIYIIYDHGRRKEKMILAARFTEEDVLSGKLVSPGSRLKIPVNQASGVIAERENWENLGKGQDGTPLIFTGI